MVNSAHLIGTGHVELAIRIFDVTQPLSFAVFNRVVSLKSIWNHIESLRAAENETYLNVDEFVGKFVGLEGVGILLENIPGFVTSPVFDENAL